MHIETWAQLIVFLQAIMPILSDRHIKTAVAIINWAKENDGKISGIDVDEKTAVITYLQQVRQVIPDSWHDENSEALMFCARLNTSPSADKWHTETGCKLWKKYWLQGLWARLALNLFLL